MTDDPITEDGFAWRTLAKDAFANLANGAARVTGINGSSGPVCPGAVGTYADPLLNEREKTHGDWSRTAWTAQQIKRMWPASDKLQPGQREALDMIATKIARIVCGNPNEPDHWRDIAGYATLVAGNLDDKPPIG